MAHACNEPLAAIGRRVHHAFILPKDLMNVWKMQDPSHMAWENESQRFQLWATNLGLYHQGHSSLDYRFRDAASLYNFAYQLLQHLEKCLAIVKGALEDELRPAKTPQRQDMTASAQSSDVCVDSSAPAPTDSFDEEDEDSDEEESFDSYQVQSLAEIAIENMRDIIDRLYRLAFKIRSPATRLGFSKAERYRDVDEDTNVNLIDVLAAFDRNHVVETFSHYRRTAPEAVLDNFLVLRLAKANTRRRQQFGQWRRHKINLDKMGQQAPVRNKSDQANSHGARMGQFMDIVRVRDQLNPSQPSMATRIDQNKISLDENTSVVSTSTCAMLSQEAEAKLFIPRLPTNLKKKKEFECPYCHVLCSRRTLDAHAWETHVLRDLRPYICTYKDCKQADQQYDSYQQWVSHETHFHEPMQLHPEQPSNDLLPHHTDAKSETDIRENDSSPSFLHEEPKNKRALLDKHRQCPICTEKNVTTSHVGFHLLKIALFALPRSTGLEDDMDQGDSEDSRLVDMNGLDSLTVDEEQEDLSGVLLNNEETQEASALSQDALHNITDSSNNTVESKVGDYLLGTQHTGEKLSRQHPSLKSVVRWIIDENRAKRLPRNLTGLEVAFGHKTIAELNVLQDLGISLSENGNLKMAEEAFQEALTKSRSLLGPEHPSTLEYTYSMAGIYRKQNRSGEAETMLQLALTGYEKVLGQEHTLTLKTIRTLGELYLNEGRLKEAEAMDQQALSGYQKLLGEEHLDTLAMLRHLAAVYRNEGRFGEAERMGRRALLRAEQSMGQGNPFTLDTTRELAIILEKLGKKDEAEELYRRISSIREKVLGRDHLDANNSMGDLGWQLRTLGNYQEAEDLYRQALHGFEKTLGEEHNSTLHVIRDLALVLYKRNKYDEAETLFRRALHGFEKILGEEHESTLHVIASLALSLHYQGKYDEAEMLFRRALHGFEKLLGEENEATLHVIRNLALPLRSQGKHDEAKIFYRRALQGYVKLRGLEHPSTKKISEAPAAMIEEKNQSLPENDPSSAEEELDPGPETSRNAVEREEEEEEGNERKTKESETRKKRRK